MKEKKYTIVIPVLNEEKRVEAGILELEKFVSLHLINEEATIVIADGNSSDRTIEIVEKLQKKFSNLHLKQFKTGGKGFQVTETFIGEQADFFIQLDVDMPVPLIYTKELIFWLNKGYDVVVGSRLMKESKAKRTVRRKIISRGYSFIVRLLFRSPIIDYQCGFKGFDTKKIKQILPIKESGYAFDTELILKGLKNGLKIKEIPVEWEERPGSKMNILKNSFQMFLSLLKLRYNLTKKSN